MTRSLRRLAAGFALVAFAFAQMAVAAYACPRDAAAIAPAQGAADEVPCDGFATPNLCQQHCDYGSASIAAHPDGVPAPDLALLCQSVAIAYPLVPPSLVPARYSAHLPAPPPPGRPLPLRI